MKQEMNFENKTTELSLYCEVFLQEGILFGCVSV